MSSSGAGYDYSASTFSPDGRIFQVYASKAVESSGTAIGVRCKDGIVLGVEKVLLSRMMLPGSNRRIYNVDKHAGISITGVNADGRQIVNNAREEAENYRATYGHRILPLILSARLGAFVHYYTLHGSLRPFGANALVACYDEQIKTHELYMIEPSGLAHRYFATAAGKGAQAAKTELEKLTFEDMTCRQALYEVARIIHTIKDPSKDKPFELELSWLCEETQWTHQEVPAALLAEAETRAKADVEGAATGAGVGGGAGAGGADVGGQAMEVV